MTQDQSKGWSGIALNGIVRGHRSGALEVL